MSLDNNKLHRTVRYVVALIAGRNYAELESATDSIRLRAEEIAEAVAAYPGEIVAHVRPEDIDVVEIDTPVAECWSVNVRLHTDREGPSDLTASLTLVQDESDRYRVELDDIHVL